MREAISTVDYHTGGEPFRIVAAPPVPLEGSTVADRRVRAMADPAADGLRQLLCFEPRGHADMYGCFITPPDDDGADFGVLFWHKDGFSTACGHGTIALGAWAVATGVVAAPPSGVTDVRIDVPSGRVTARVHTAEGLVTAVDFVSVPSFAVARDVEISTTRGPVLVDVGFGGALYAHLRAADVGLRVDPAHLGDLIAIGREVKWTLNDSPHARHPSDDRLSGIYGTILYDEVGPLHQRNVAIFADGEVDRSPCGSGTASRMATLFDRGLLRVGQTFVHDSIVRSTFEGVIVAETMLGSRPAVVPQITGMAYQCGTAEFTVDPRDPFVPGFVLR
jgi:proline racemase